MEFKVQKRKEHPNKELYKQSDLLIVRKFSTIVMKEFSSFVKAIVLFGSTARNKSKSADIDILIVVDDINLAITPEFAEAYRIILEKIIVKTSSRIHITTLKFTSFWEYVRVGDPVAVNILRDGIPIIDTGFFDPLQQLLYQGRIRPTQESIYSYFHKAPETIRNSKRHIISAVVDLYWAVIDAAHAALMHVGEIPPSPAQVPELFKKKLVDTKMFDKKYISMIDNFFYTYKRIASNDINEITPQQYQLYLNQAEEFVGKVEVFLKS